MKYLISNGFEIRYNNDLHLKLYIFDENGYLSSSNLTRSGFENSVEITSTIDKPNLEKCKLFFNKIWSESEDRKVTKELIEENYSRYLLLKKRTEYIQPKKLKINVSELSLPNTKIEDLIDLILKGEQDYSYIEEKVVEANKDRINLIEKIKKGFSVEDFYAPEGNSKRELSLFYRFMYGKEGFLAGTGLREKQVKEVFENPKFPEIISYIYPPIIGEQEWNLENKENYRELCNGIFDYRIAQYVETLPIRLVSYFYPDKFLPIFKLDHLERICLILGLRLAENVSKGDKLFAFNSFLLERMKYIPRDNYIKSTMAYQLYYTVELFNALSNGESYDQYLAKYKEIWIRELIKNGYKMIQKIKEHG